MGNQKLNSQMQKLTYTALALKLATAWNGIELGADETVEDVFALFDEDEDGNLNCKETRAFWEAYGDESRTAKQFKMVARKFNKDDVKGLNVEEFGNLVNHRHVATPVVAPDDTTQGCGLLFVTYDADGDNQLYRKEKGEFLRDAAWGNEDWSKKQTRKLARMLGKMYDFDDDKKW